MSKIFKTGIFYKPYLYFNLYFKNRALKKRKTYSQHREDLFIDDYFKDKENGFYLDIGCYHPIKYSNTALLFNRGWKGINIDAEAHDFEVLEGIDLDIYKAKLICIEMLDFENKINEKKFQDYLTKYNYNLIKIIGPNGIFELKN